MDVILTFEAVSNRARRVLERAGGSVFDRTRHGRSPVRVRMPERADWFCGKAAVERGRATAEPLEYEAPYFRFTVFTWPRPIQAAVLVSDDKGRLWHWRDAECPRREVVEIVDVAEATGWDPGAAVASW